MNRVIQVASSWGENSGGFTIVCDLPSLTKDDDWVEEGMKLITACVTFSRRSTRAPI